MGGLGNQLFQYAAGKALAVKHGVPLKLDLTFLNTDPKGQHTWRKPELQRFQLDYQVCTPAELGQFQHTSALSSFLPLSMRKTYVANQQGFDFDANFFSYPKNTYLNGFWQSEKYFSHIRPVLLKELVHRAPVPAACATVEEQIRASHSVSLHIRRGDYVTDKNAQSYHGNLSLDYYHDAITYLQRLHNPLKLFIFSDDMEWVKANLNGLNDAVYVDVNTGDHNSFDLYLMSLCRHNIIANSSFSWWGAWLNQHAGKTVIAPRQWFATNNLDTKDLLPETWIKL